MKHLLLALISFYRIVLFPLTVSLFGIRMQCRYDLTCSRYATAVIEEFGVITGTVLAVKRLLSCQSFVQAYGHR